MNKLKTKFFFYLYKIYYGYVLKSHSSKILNYNWKNIKIKRSDIINCIIKKIKNDQNITSINYLEIGCFDDQNFNSIDSVNVEKFGVDPVTGGNIRLTSDSFFEKNSKKFHCVFIDGLHEYNQVQKDILNSINNLHEGGYIILHDCIPRNYIEEHVPRFPGNFPWTGDVWKTCVELSKSSGVNFKIFLCDNGVGVLTIDKNLFEYKYLNDLIGHNKFRDFIEKFYKDLNTIKINSIKDLKKFL